MRGIDAVLRPLANSYKGREGERERVQKEEHIVRTIDNRRGRGRRRRSYIDMGVISNSSTYHPQFQ